MRMQIAFRETDETRSGYSVALAGGVIETSPDDRLSYDECRVSFQLSFREDGVPFSAFCHRTPTRLATDSILLDTCTLEDLLTVRMERNQPSDFLNAEFAMRETALPASIPGATSYAFSGLVYLERDQTISYSEACQLESRSDLGDRAMFFRGVLGADFRPEVGEIDVVEEMRGAKMDQLLQKPWWGFAEEAYSLPGTMRRGNYEQIERFQDFTLQRAILRRKTNTPDFGRGCSISGRRACSPIRSWRATSRPAAPRRTSVLRIFPCRTAPRSPVRMPWILWSRG